MNPIVRNIIIVILALFVGAQLNLAIINYGPLLIPPPDGVDPGNLESIKANMSSYGAIHFVTIFLAHALGTLASAFIIGKFAASQHKRLILIPGILFLFGGIGMAIMLPEFWKFSIIDIVLAYIPMAYLGWILAGKK